MKRLEYLINDSRAATDNLDTNGVKDREIIRYFNDAVKMIQLLVFKADPLCSHFIEEEIYTEISADTELDLPADCYSKNAICTVEGRFGVTNINQGYTRIRRVWQEDRSSLWGYVIRNSTLLLTGQNLNNQLDSLRLTYFKRLPRFDKRWGTIASVAGSTLNLTGATDSDITLIDDTISVVDADGTIIQGNIKVSSYGLPTSLTVSTSTPLLPAVAAGHFIVSGGYSTTSCDLPEECEPYLLAYVEFCLRHRNNYTDAVRQKAWTDEQKASIVDLFSNNTKDITAPPITDFDFMEI
jgi:hypothetical protein